MKAIVKINYHSAVDVITNSSTEIFCQITSDDFLKEIQEALSKILNRGVYISPLYNPLTDEEDSNCIEFGIEYGDNDNLTGDFVNLIEFYLDSTIGKENYKINKDVY